MKISFAWILLAYAKLVSNSVFSYRKVDLINNPYIFRASGVAGGDHISQTELIHDVEELQFQQKLDHFSAKDNRSFDQRFFSSHRFWRENAAVGIMFVCVGGEGPPLDKTVLVDSVHCTGDMLATARALYDEDENCGILLFALEHRFYGKSFPFPNNSTVSNLLYLTSQQAAADLAHFVRRQTSSFSIPIRSTILFGGSYPGMMAAFARLKYPHLIDGAVSHSAPVEARLDFKEYNGHVGRVLPTPECRRILLEGHAELARNTSAYTHLFPLCNVEQLLTRRNKELWLGDGVVSLSVQGNDPSCTESEWCNLKGKCEVLERSFLKLDNSSVEALATLARRQAGSTCIDLDWSNFVAEVADPTSDSGLRSWIWQTCTEFGFYQTCTDADCPYAQGWHQLDQDLELCAKAFPGIPTPSLDMIDRTNEWSGGWWMKSDRILSVVGTTDPWTELAAKSRVTVPGASHHFWTHPARPTDSSEVRSARKLVTSVVSSWVRFANDLESTV